MEDTVRDFNEPDEGDPSKAPLACPFLPDFICPVLRRRLVGRRILAGTADASGLRYFRVSGKASRSYNKNRTTMLFDWL